MGTGWRLYDFPLEPKKHWNFSASAFLRGKYENYEFSNRVDKIEEVKTAAGTFKAYRIVRSITLKGGPGPGAYPRHHLQTTSCSPPT